MAVTQIPVWERVLITIDEAAAYCHISAKQVRAILDSDEELYLRNGNRRMIKRERFEKFLANATDISVLG